MRGFDFSKLDNHYTIGTNFIVRDYPNLKALVFLDTSFWVLAERDIVNFKGELYTTKDTIPSSFRPPNLRIIKTLNNEIGEEESAECMSVMGRLSGLAALNIAVIKKFDPIYLLGYDMQGPNYYDQAGSPDVSFSKSPMCAGRFEKFKNYNVINLNPQSYLSAFPKVSDHDFAVSQ